jgi:hypothetical protein
MQITVTFGEGKDKVIMTDKTDSVEAYLEDLSNGGKGWKLDEITSIETDPQTTIDTRNGTLIYEVTEKDSGFSGKITHILHKRPEFKGRTLTRFSKVYKTERGAQGYLDRQMALQNS